MEKKLICLFAFMLYSFSSYGLDDFKYIKIKKKFFKNKNKNKKAISVDLSPFYLFACKERGDCKKENKKNQVLKTETENLPPLYGQIVDFLQDKFQKIGSQKSRELNEYNMKFNLGKVNFSGISWQRPMGQFTIGANRTLAPDLYHDSRWIVLDKFYIEVDAATFLGKMKEDGLIDISNSSLSLFAGLKFRRIYYYSHLANTFIEGLTTNYHKLFLGFFAYYGLGLDLMDRGDWVTRQDALVIYGGGVAQSPPIYDISGSIAALVSYQILAETKIYRPLDESKYLDIIFNKGQGVSVGISGSVQADFYQILKITLLSMDFSYEYKETDEIYLSFPESAKEEIQKEPLKSEVKKLLHYKKINENILRPYLKRRKHLEKENLDFQYLLLMTGGRISKDTESLYLTNNDYSKRFFRYRSKEFFFLENLESKIVSILVRNFLHIPLSPKYEATFTRNLKIDYTNLVKFSPSGDDEEIDLLENTSDFSLMMEKRLTFLRTWPFFFNPSKKLAKIFLNNYLEAKDQEAFDKQEKTKKLFSDDFLRGPIIFSIKFLFEKKSLDYFLSLPPMIVYLVNQKNCEKHEGPFIARICRDELGRVFQKFFEDKKKYKSLPLWRMRDVFEKIHVYATDKETYEDYFGTEFYTHGSFQAQTKHFMSFLHIFDKGRFKGLGIIDQFTRDLEDKDLD